MNHLGTLDHHYQDLNQPFGFVFCPPDDPAPAPEAPAAGEPLLTDFELNSSTQFFERFQNDTSLFDDPKFLESFDAFSHEPLPNFQGVSSSLGNPLHDSTSPIHTLDFASIGTTDLTSRFGEAQLSSPTVGEHPSLQNLNHFSQPYNFNSNARKTHRAHSDLFGTQDLFPQKQAESRSAYGRQSAPTARRYGAPMNARQADPKHESVHKDRAELENGTDDTRPGRRPIPVVSFGSDSDFSGRKYAAPGANLEDLQSREATMQANLLTFEKKWDETELDSPTGTKAKRRLTGVDAPDHRRGYLISHDADDDDGQPVKKAKKVQRDDDDDSTDDGSATRPAGKKAKAKAKARTSSEGALAARRKSSAPAVDPKAPRQNLTEGEKKQNHIRSEQKRRNQIKEGFANLSEMMPDSSAGASKCAILSQAVDWLAGLIDGNQQLRAQLESMG